MRLFTAFTRYIINREIRDMLGVPLLWISSLNGNAGIIKGDGRLSVFLEYTEETYKAKDEATRLKGFEKYVGYASD